MLRTRLWIVAAFFGAAVYGEDVTLPLDDGNIVISARFIRQNAFGSYVPEIALKITNQTSSPWRTLKLQFDIGGLCNGKPRQWTIPVVTSVGWMEDRQLVKEYRDTVVSLVGKVDGCKAEIIRARLLLAENSEMRIEGVTERGLLGLAALEGRGCAAGATPPTASKPFGKLNRGARGGREWVLFGAGGSQQSGGEAPWRR